MNCDTQGCKIKARLKVWDLTTDTYIICCDSCREMYEHSNSIVVELWSISAKVKAAKKFSKLNKN
jgi:hypothetical protein